MCSADFTPIRKYKKRNLKDLTANDQTNIVYAHLIEYYSQEEVAKKYKVSSTLVHRLCSRFRKDPSLLSKQYSKEEKLDMLKKAVIQITSDALSKSRPIWKADIIQKTV